MSGALLTRVTRWKMKTCVTCEGDVCTTALLSPSGAQGGRFRPFVTTDRGEALRRPRPFVFYHARPPFLKLCVTLTKWDHAPLICKLRCRWQWQLVSSALTRISPDQSMWRPIANSGCWPLLQVIATPSSRPGAETLQYVADKLLRSWQWSRNSRILTWEPLAFSSKPWVMRESWNFLICYNRNEKICAWKLKIFEKYSPLRCRCCECVHVVPSMILQNSNNLNERNKAPFSQTFSSYRRKEQTRVSPFCAVDIGKLRPLWCPRRNLSAWTCSEYRTLVLVIIAYEHCVWKIIE